MTRDVIVIGGGHNGLVAACYLAKAGADVLVVEALDQAGGGSRSAETVPGFRFDLHSVAHNLINMTSIPRDLDLAGAGLEYQEMDPFSIAVFEDGRRVRFWRSLEATVASIAETSAIEAAAYRRFIERATPIVMAMLPAVRGEVGVASLPGRLRGLARLLRRSPLTTAADVLAPYDTLLRRHLRSDLTRGPVAAFAAHAGVGPPQPGGALFAFWQAAYHLHGQWHARCGSQSLVDALVRRLWSYGGELRRGARVARIDAAGGRVRALELEDGERLETRVVVAALDPQVTLLQLLDPPLTGPVADELGAVRRGNVVQALVHVATTALPAYINARPGDWNGLQSYVDRLDDLSTAWTQAEARQMPDRPPLYAFTPSALDPTLAAAGLHTVYLASPAAPAQVSGGWGSREEEFVERCLDTVERRAPGFRASIVGISVRTPEAMMLTDGWRGAHPMHIDITLDQLGPLRPTRRLASHRTPIPNLVISGAGTSPTGGVAGTPGRLAARVALDILGTPGARTARRRSGGRPERWTTAI
jgi:phytoene dehydrogenase-like protein